MCIRDRGSSSSVREYAAFVRIIDPPRDLIPGMNASVTIQTRFEQDVLQAPLQCIYAANNTNFVLRKTGEDRFETVEVKVMGENSQNVWIESGVDENDELIMNPGQYKDLMTLPKEETESRIVLPDGTQTSTEAGPSSNTELEAPSADGQGKRGRGEGKRGRGEGKRGGGGEGKRGGGGGGGFDINRIIDMTMDRYDTNQDGKLDATEQEEFDERAAGMKTSADKDGDGSITRDEVKAYMDEAMKRFSRSGAGGGGGGGPR